MAKPTVLERESFSKLTEGMDIPYLLQVQLNSYNEFLKKGIRGIFKEIFPIVSYDEQYSLEFVSYRFDAPKYEVDECQRRGMTYSAPLKVTLRLKCKGSVREQEIYMGDIPLMTDTGGFIINGADRVVVSQMQRSPGVCYEKKMQVNERRIFSGRIIPYRGAWVEFEFDVNDILYVYIDRRKKMLATTFLRALGYSTDEEILELFYSFEKVKIKTKDDFNKVVGRRLLHPVINKATGEILAESLEALGLPIVKEIYALGIKEVSLIKTEGDPAIINTLSRDVKKDEKEALLDIYRRMLTGDPTTY